jgi:hypothetical protein
MPQVALHRIIQDGVAIVKANVNLLDDIFQYYTSEPMNADYGQSYIDDIKLWLTKTKVPVVQAWNLNMQQVPQIGIQLAQESEAEDKAAIGDHWGDGEESNIGVGVFNVNLDVILMGTKNTDEVLWLYYIVNYILFKRKRQAEALGLQLHTFAATDYSKDMMRMPENVYSRTIRFRTTVQNFWDSEPYLNIEDMEVGVTYESTGDEEDLTTQFIIELDD